MTRLAMQFRSSEGLAWVLGAALALAGVSCGRDGGSRGLPSATPSAVVAPQKPLAPGLAARVAEGAKTYEHYCQLCHAKDATGYAADNAPSLVSKTFLESASDAYIAAGIRLGRPNTAMAAYGVYRGGPLSERDISGLLAFLRSKGPASVPLLEGPLSGDVTRGASVFEKNCQSCHGTATVRGSAVHLHNPELLNAATPGFLRYAILNGRAPTPMPAFQGKLGEPELSDVISYLESLKPTSPTPEVQNPQVPDNLPIVINPKGSRPNFTLREERFVPADDVKKALDAKQRIVIIDARSPADWIQFHIPGAISLPYHDQSHLDRIPKDGTWVVAYCACPHHASGEVVDALRSLKYPNTAVLDEGILVWKDRGYAIVGEAVPNAATAPSSAPKPGVAAKLGVAAKPH
jgi:cytochrome c oxidase cbb3-type subunit 3